MGFITIDTLKQAEREINAAEVALDDDQPQAAMLRLSNAFQELERAAQNQGEDGWFARRAYQGHRTDLHAKLAKRKARLRPDDEEVQEVIREIKELAVKTRDKTVPKVQEFAEDRGDDIIPDFQFSFRDEITGDGSM